MKEDFEIWTKDLTKFTIKAHNKQGRLTTLI